MNTKYIWTDSNRMSGQPCLRNHRITVAQLLYELANDGQLGRLMEMGLSEEECKGMLKDIADYVTQKYS